MSSPGNLKNSGRFYTNFKFAWILGEFQTQIILPAAYNILTLLFTLIYFSRTVSQLNRKCSPAQFLHFSKFVSSKLLASARRRTLHRSTLHNPKGHCSLQAEDALSDSFSLAAHPHSASFAKKRKPKNQAAHLIFHPNKTQEKKIHKGRRLYTFYSHLYAASPWKPWQVLRTRYLYLWVG